MMLRKKITLKKMNKYALYIYICTLFVFVYDVELVRISELAFILFVSTTVIKIFKTKIIKINKIFIPIILLLVFSTLSIIWSVDKGMATTRLITLYQLIILFFFVYQSVDDEDDVKHALNSIIIGGLGMSLYSMYYYGFENILIALIDGLRLGGDITQENTFGYYSAITSVLLINFYSYTKLKIYLVLFALPMMFVFTSGSRRSVLLAFVGFFSSLFFAQIKNNKRIKMYIKMLVLILGAILSIYFISQIEFFERFTSFISFIQGEASGDNSLMTRESLITSGFELFKERPVLGFGLHQFRVVHGLKYGEFMSAHNGYVNILVELGIIGFILYYIIYIKVLFKLIHLIKHQVTIVNSSLIILLILQLVSDIATITFWDKLTYILFGLCFSYLNHNERSNI